MPFPSIICVLSDCQLPVLRTVRSISVVWAQSVTGVPQEIMAVVARAAPLMILYMLGYEYAPLLLLCLCVLSCGKLVSVAVGWLPALLRLSGGALICSCVFVFVIHPARFLQ